MNIALIAVQLEINNRVLASADAYRRHIEDQTARAVDAAGEAEQRLIVFPEIAGHVALLAMAPPRAHRANTMGGVLGAAVMHRPLDMLRGLAAVGWWHPKQAALAALAPDGEKFWRSIFSPLARRHAAYIVAGSHLRLTANGKLTNASLLFAPDGQCIATTEKVNLVPGMEDSSPNGLGLTRGNVEVPIVETPLGRVTTLVCYDGFNTAHTSDEQFVALGPQIASRGGVTIAANPAANPWPWAEAWPPRDLKRAAHAYPSRGDQWQQEGLPDSLAKVAFARWAITAHLVGNVLDLHFDGVSEILETGGDRVQVIARAPHHDRGGFATAVVSTDRVANRVSGSVLPATI